MYDQIKKIPKTPRRPKLVTNPANVKAVQDIISNLSKDIHIIYPYEVIGDPIVPVVELKPTGKIIWAKNGYIDYSVGPAEGSKLSWDEYVEMCIFFKWAKKEMIESMLIYEVSSNDNTFYDMIGISAAFKHMENQMMQNIEKQIFAQDNNIPLFHLPRDFARIIV